MIRYSEHFILFFAQITLAYRLQRFSFLKNFHSALFVTNFFLGDCIRISQHLLLSIEHYFRIFRLSRQASHSPMIDHRLQSRWGGVERGRASSTPIKIGKFIATQTFLVFFLLDTTLLSHLNASRAKLDYFGHYIDIARFHYLVID